ncbi:MAG: pyridoxal-phosphate dependent enzyme, partial [Actinomycetota bacterium]|nr:pyridoxal-phosphate dependent enzyme [Actinomycetota bacterium]
MGTSTDPVEDAATLESSTTRAGDKIGLADIRAAATLLSDVVNRTPLAASRDLATKVGGPVWFKCENLQRTGSFKIRGAYNRMHALTAAERRSGVVAASAGNHAQGVA